MEQVLLFALLGLGSGTVFAGLAIALVITYRGAGIINLASGSVMMVGAYSCWALTDGILGFTVSLPVACFVTLLVSAAVGLVLEMLVFRPLRFAPPLAKLVASLGLLLVSQAGVLLAFGESPRTGPSILPDGSVDVFGGTLPTYDLVLPAIALAVAGIVWFVYKRTRFGLATRAAAESEPFAVLLGLSPATLALANTLGASVVAGGLGIITAPVSAIDPYTMPLQVVPALAAALFAGFVSVPVAAVAGLLIGSVENILYYAQTQSWFPTDSSGQALPGIQDLLTFILVAIAMFLRGAALPRRGEMVARRLPRVVRPTNVVKSGGMALVIGVVALIALPGPFRGATVNTEIAFVLALSLVVITGFVGQISVVQLALSGCAGFITSLLATRAGIGFPLGPIIAVLLAMALGVLTAISALRIRGAQLVVVTLAAAVALQNFWFQNPTWGAGPSGARVPEPEIFGIDLGNSSGFRGLDGQLPSPVLGICILAVAVLLGMWVSNLPRTVIGRRMLAVRSNEVAAAATGVDVRQTKLVAFAIGSFIAGIAGTMFAYNFGSVAVDSFDALTALTVIAYLYLGGVTMVSGALIAGLLATEALVPHALSVWFGINGTWTVLFGGLAVVANLIMYPDGIAGVLHEWRARRFPTAARRAAAERPLAEITSPAPPMVDEALRPVAND